jgi:methyltransferase (TIGR00027 family)
MDTELNAIGSTALGIALARSQESRRADRLFEDPFAAGFVAAAADRRLPGAMTGAAADEWAFLAHHVAVRTRFFDDFLADAVDAGSRQVVLLAAGLDTRGVRLAWTAGRVRVFELDQPGVLAFKERVLDGARPRDAERFLVPVDLREDWGPALTGAGFDAGSPAAWLIEGLLPVLTAAQADAVLTRLTALAAPGSRLAYDDLGDPAAVLPLLARLDPALVDLWKGGPDRDPRSWLRGHGWEADVSEQSYVSLVYGRREPDQPARPRPRFVRGVR